MQTSGGQRREIVGLRPMFNAVIASAATFRRSLGDRLCGEMDCFAALAMTLIGRSVSPPALHNHQLQ